MAYIRTKQHREGGNYYHYIVESKRDALGRPRQKVVKYLGKMSISSATAGSILRNLAIGELEALTDIEAAFFGDNDFAEE